MCHGCALRVSQPSSNAHTLSIARGEFTNSRQRARNGEYHLRYGIYSRYRYTGMVQPIKSPEKNYSVLRNVHDTSQYFLQQPFIGISYQRCFLARYSVVLFVLLRRGWPTLPAYCQRILAPATRSGIAAWAAAKVYCWLIPIFFGVRSRMMASLFQMPLQPTTPVTQHITPLVSWSVLHSSYTKR